MKILKPIFILLIPLLVAAQSKKEDPLYKKAVELAHKFIIIDTHVDVPYRLKSHWEDISQRTEGGHFDYIRAKAGGLDAPFMSIYIPASYEGTGNAKPLADSLINMVEGFQKQWPEKFAVAVSADDVKSQFKKGLISLPMGKDSSPCPWEWKTARRLKVI